MTVPKFDIFRGEADKEAIWVECVPGFDAANNRMRQLANETHDPYFVFDALSHEIVASIDRGAAIRFLG